MNPLGPEVLSAGKAIGLLGNDGTPSADWFQSPIESLRGMFTSPQRKAAFLDLLDRLFPPDPAAATAANEKWHPLLGNHPAGKACGPDHSAGIRDDCHPGVCRH